MKTRNPRVYLRLGTKERMTVALDYKVFEFLSTSSEPCQDDLQYNKDDCIDDALHKVTVFENHRKSLIQHCERSELRLHYEWTKVH